MTAYY